MAQDPEAAPELEQVPPGAPRGAGVALLIGAAAALAVLLWLVASEGDLRYLVNGNGYPGALTAYGSAVGRLVGTVAAALTFGSISYAVFRTRALDSGELGLRGYLTQLQARRYAAVWAVVSVPMIFLAAAEGAAQDLVASYRVGGLGVLISASETAKGWIVSLICAVAVYVALRTAYTWVAHLWILLPALVGLLATVVTANETQNWNHDYSTAALTTLAPVAALWLGGLWSAVRLPARPERRWIGPVYAALALVNGAVIAVIMAPGSDLWVTWYGQLLLATGVLLVAAGAAHWLRALPVAAALLTAAFGTAIAASELTPPPFLRSRPTVGENFLGYNLPDPPSAMAFLGNWRLDLNLAPFAIALAVGYLILVRRTADWPWYRTVLFLLGCATLLTLTSSGLRTYSNAMFSVHMVVHMLMTSIVPVFLLLGAPITLLQRTLRGAAARWLSMLLESRSFAVLMRPVVQLALFAAVLYVLYFTPLFDSIGRFHWGHLAIYAALLFTGFLFYWRVFQIDPVPTELPFIGRIGMLLAMMPITMVFALIVMTMDGLVGSRLYLYLDFPWMTDLHRDQFVGGVVAWATDEAAIALVTLGLVLHWAWRNRDEDSEPELL
ncbi:cytochrome c oxidase assembly protein [Tsukamurella spumae]|uniref:Cytochrome c oxidase assembly protein n=1 Tax=Tsukamurella spumae TaxID=44753 RepID=A0A846X255_9ACTN|nr:cytochrome c oxidase assembly protein [Tsukamurella spumae]NKY19697.1 cytochrome c oxidase assembly protein [Tsukamurella spumae]